MVSTRPHWPRGLSLPGKLQPWSSAGSFHQFLTRACTWKHNVLSSTKHLILIFRRESTSGSTYSTSASLMSRPIRVAGGKSTGRGENKFTNNPKIKIIGTLHQYPQHLTLTKRHLNKDKQHRAHQDGWTCMSVNCFFLHRTTLRMFLRVFGNRVET